MYKVLNINNYHYGRGGSDVYFLQLTKLLEERGHQVATFASSRGTVESPQWLMSPSPMGVDTSSTLNPLNIARFIYSVDAKEKFRKVVETFKPDIAHLHIYYGQLTASILSVLDEYQIPVVQTLHEYKLVCPTQGLYANGHDCEACKGRRYWHAMLKRCNRGSLARSFLSMVESYLSDFLGAKTNIDQFIAVSEYQKGRLIKLGVQSETMEVIPHFLPYNFPCASHKGEYFLFVGRIIEAKGIATLLKAYSLLEDKTIPLKIVGTGAELPYWQKYAVNLGIERNVQWLGYQSGEALQNIYQDCLLLINPSQLNETFGLTCLEAMAHGKPVIASDTGAFSEVVTDGENGFLVQPNNPEQLAAMMNKFSQRELDAPAIGRRAYVKANEKFSQEKHYQAILNAYDLALKKYNNKS